MCKSTYRNIARMVSATEAFPLGDSTAAAREAEENPGDLQLKHGETVLTHTMIPDRNIARMVSATEAFPLGDSTAAEAKENPGIQLYLWHLLP